MSDTPRTDAEADRLGNGYVRVEFAARLERELAMAKSDVSRMDWLIKQKATVFASDMADHWVYVNERAKERMGIGHTDLRKCLDEAMRAWSDK